MGCPVARKMPEGAYQLCEIRFPLKTMFSQNVSCGLAVSSNAYAGVAPPAMDFDPMREPPSVTAARHARKFATNVAPVCHGVELQCVFDQGTEGLLSNTFDASLMEAVKIMSQDGQSRA